MGLVATRADAIILYDTGDPTRNTTAPTGSLAGSGWELQGNWGNFLGTPISPNYFITAKHVGGSVGQTFTYNGTTYTAVSSAASSSADLTLWKVSTPFSTYAKLYTGNQEAAAGNRLMVYGRGTQRGEEIRDAATNTLKGWRWGSSDRVQRWGQNDVASITNWGGSLGELLVFAFNANGGANEAHLSSGDSGGGVFLKDPADGQWKLAGINYAVDGSYNTTGTGSGFSGAVFDRGGLYYGSSSSWSLVSDTTVDKPSNFYATRISANAAWILSLTNHWTANSSGVWNTGSNWASGSAPNGVGAIATVSGMTGGSRTLTLSSGVTLGTLDLMGTTSTTIAGQSLTFSSSGGGSSLSVSTGTHGIASPVVMSNDLAVSVGSGATLTFGGSVSGEGKTLTKTGDGTLNFNSVPSTGLSLQGGATNISASSINGVLRVAGSSTTANSNAGTLNVSSLELAGGTLNTRNLVNPGNITVSAPTKLNLVTSTGGTNVVFGGSGSKVFHADLNIGGSGVVTLARSGGSVSVASGARITLAGATQLLLAGALPTTDSGASRVNIVNNSANTTGGLMVVGTNQSVGAISGSGKTTITGGATLTADSIEQGALNIESGSLTLRSGSKKISKVDSLNIGGLSTLSTATSDVGVKVSDDQTTVKSEQKTEPTETSEVENVAESSTLKMQGSIIPKKLPSRSVKRKSRAPHPSDRREEEGFDTDDLAVVGASMSSAAGGALRVQSDYSLNGVVYNDDFGVYLDHNDADVLERPLSVGVAAVPEPSGIALVGVGLLGLISAAIRRRLRT